MSKYRIIEIKLGVYAVERFVTRNTFWFQKEYKVWERVGDYSGYGDEEYFKTKTFEFDTEAEKYIKKLIYEEKLPKVVKEIEG